MNNILYLPVSIGEGLDKLSILDIKLNKSNDSRRVHILNEYNLLYNLLKDYIVTNNKLYNYIKKINILIWDLMDILRDNKDVNNYTELCIKCIEYNDIRFRIKNKINLLSLSDIKEQKCYNITKLYIFINDKIDNIELFFNYIEYYSFFYDEIYIHSNNNKLINYFKYDTTIIINNKENTYDYTFSNNTYSKLEIENIFNITINIFD
jgi:hypothetical protein